MSLRFSKVILWEPPIILFFNLMCQLKMPTSKLTTSSKKVNLEMSTYIDDSLISKVNKADIGQWVTVSQDFLDVLSFATTLCKDTQGIYDVSIGKLVNLWGFGPDSVDKQPSTEELSYFSSQVGCNSIETDPTNLSIKKAKDVELDFSSIAKGFALDKVYEFLIKQSYLNSFFIEIGGD